MKSAVFFDIDGITKNIFQTALERGLRSLEKTGILHLFAVVEPEHLFRIRIYLAWDLMELFVPAVAM